MYQRITWVGSHIDVQPSGISCLLHETIGFPTELQALQALQVLGPTEAGNPELCGSLDRAQVHDSDTADPGPTHMSCRYWVIYKRDVPS